MNIAENIKNFKSKLPEHVRLCAVSKTKPKEDIEAAYGTGHRIFGENRVQEMTEKWEQLPKDIEWHMIGHVQTNKVKYMAPYVSLIHSVGRIKLVKEIQKQAQDADRVIDILLQVKIAEEDSKYGMPTKEATALLEGDRLSDFPNVNLVGLMGMATFTDDMEQVGKEFQIVEGLFDRFRESKNLKILSTGMSGDYETAIAHGSNMVRIGSAIFGAR